MTVKLKRFLENLIDGYSDEAPENADYPYKVFSARKLSDDDGIAHYILEVNVWDKGKTYSRAETLMDELEKKLNKQTFLVKELFAYTYTGSRENVSDPDRAIKRVREQFELRVVEREE